MSKDDVVHIKKRLINNRHEQSPDHYGLEKTSVMDLDNSGLSTDTLQISFTSYGHIIIALLLLSL